MLLSIDQELSMILNEDEVLGFKLVRSEVEEGVIYTPVVLSGYRVERFGGAFGFEKKHQQKQQKKTKSGE